MGRRTSVCLDDDLHAAVKASGIPLAAWAAALTGQAYKRELPEYVARGTA